MQLFGKSKKGFTIVELVVVIVVIGILAGITIVSYGAWRQTIAENNVKSDLNNLSAAMDSARTWANGYPVMTQGADFSTDSKAAKVFQPSDDITITYGDGDSKSYCVDASSKKVPSAYFFMRVTNGATAEPKKGTCAGGEGATPAPTGAEWTLFVYDLNQAGCDLTIQLPITSPTSAAGKIIDWGDGSTGTLSSLATHTYATKGLKTVAYNGPIATINSVSVATANRGCLKELKQWGNGASPTKVSFQYSTNIAKVAQPPSSVTDMSSMFYGATSFNQDISSWNVSNVTNLSSMFFNAKAFNQPIGSWNTSKVTNMYGVFSGATAFNQSLNSWNTSNVVSLANMFYNATAFNQPIGSWDTSKVTAMMYTFLGAANFNQPLNSWNTANVTSLAYMFYGAAVFNQPVNLWNISKVTNTSCAFYGAKAFNQPLNSWNTANVTDMSCMFSGATAFNQPLDAWNTSKVTTMYNMFGGATSFNQDINSWDVSNVTAMNSMFYLTANFNKPLNSWNTVNVTTMNSMFWNATAFNQPLNTWNTANVTNMNQMFSSATKFNQDLSSWNVTKVTPKPPTAFDANASLWALPRPVW